MSIQQNNLTPFRPYQGPDILNSKKDEALEIVLEFFDHCNLQCSFCWQDHTPISSYYDITKHTEKAKDIITRYNNTRFDICMMGGEVFVDDIDDSMFDQYARKIRELDTFSKNLGKRCSFRMVSNLVFKKRERVRCLITTLIDDGIDFRLATSYDTTGRFSKTDLIVYMENIKLFKQHIREVSFVLTRPTITALLKDKDDNFKYLYDNNYNLYFDYYSPYTSANTETMVPSDEELLQAFAFLIKKYPKTSPVKIWINEIQNKLSCLTSHVVLSNGEMGQCRVCGVIPEHYETPVNLIDKRQMEENFLMRNNCFSCEYYNRCTMGCFLLHDYLKRERLSVCIYALLFDMITKGIEISDNISYKNATRYVPNQSKKIIPIIEESNGTNN